MEDTRTVSLPQRHMLQFSISQLNSCPITESPEDPKLLEKKSTGVSRIPAIPAERGWPVQWAEHWGPTHLGLHKGCSGPAPKFQQLLGNQPSGFQSQCPLRSPHPPSRGARLRRDRGSAQGSNPAVRVACSSVCSHAALRADVSGEKAPSRATDGAPGSQPPSLVRLLPVLSPGQGLTCCQPPDTPAVPPAPGFPGVAE